MTDPKPIPAQATSQHNLAGAVIWRRDESGPQVALVEKGGRWTLPRTAVKQSEDRATIAARLASEWTGRPATGIGFLGLTNSRVDDHDLCTWYFAFVVDSIGLAKEQAWLRWMPVEEALPRLSSPEERALLRSSTAPKKVRGGGLHGRGTGARAQALCTAGLLFTVFAAAGDRALLGQNLLYGALGANLTALVVNARTHRWNPAPAWIGACAGAACAYLGHALGAGPAWVISLGVGISLLTTVAAHD